MSDDNGKGNPPLTPLEIAPGDAWVLLKVPMGTSKLETFASPEIPPLQVLTLLVGGMQAAMLSINEMAKEQAREHRIINPFRRG